MTYLNSNMCKRLIPSYTKNSIFEIDLAKLTKLGYSYIFCDLDNTLANPYVYLPEDRVIELVNNIKKEGLTLYIFSNNKEKRVSDYANPLNVKYLYQIKKPSTKKVTKYIIDNNIDTKKAIVIGDQALTDILMANRLHIDSILVNALTSTDEPITFFPRLVDKIAKKIIYKKGLAKEF